jgi:membrane protease YdiL (CAAX protease family)
MENHDTTIADDVVDVQTLQESMWGAVVTRFIILAYGISWFFWVPAVVIWLRMGIEPPWWLYVAALLGAYGPSVAAIIVAQHEGGGEGRRSLLRMLSVWRAGWAWWAVAVLGFPAMLLAAVALYGMTGGVVGEFAAGSWYLTIPVVMLTALPFGPLGEELGWRGYALPKLQERHNALVSSLIIGALWAFWHLPVFWAPGAALAPGTPVGPVSVGSYWLSVTGTAILFTWLFNNTRGSVLLAIILHLSVNASGRIIFPMFPDLGSDGTAAVTMWSNVVKWAVVILVVAVFGWRRLSRASDPSRPATTQ